AEECEGFGVAAEVARRLAEPFEAGDERGAVRTELLLDDRQGATMGGLGFAGAGLLAQERAELVEGHGEVQAMVAPLGEADGRADVPLGVGVAPLPRGVLAERSVPRGVGALGSG